MNWLMTTGEITDIILPDALRLYFISMESLPKYPLDLLAAKMDRLFMKKPVDFESPSGLCNLEVTEFFIFRSMTFTSRRIGMRP